MDAQCNHREILHRRKSRSLQSGRSRSIENRTTGQWSAVAVSLTLMGIETRHFGDVTDCFSGMSLIAGFTSVLAEITGP